MLVHAPRELSVPEADLPGLLVAADQLQFTDLLPEITKRVTSTLTVQNCLQLHALGDRHSLPELAEAAMSLALERFEELGKSMEEASWDQVHALVSSDQLAARPSSRRWCGLRRRRGPRRSGCWR